MMENLVRDQALVPSVKRQFSSYYDYLAAARDVLMAGRTARGRARERVAAAIGHSLAFTTWQLAGTGAGTRRQPGRRPDVPARRGGLAQRLAENRCAFSFGPPVRVPGAQSGLAKQPLATHQYDFWRLEISASDRSLAALIV